MVRAVWSAELAADRYVVDNGRREALLRALATQDSPAGGHRWVLARLSHPPPRLRRWAVTGGSGRTVAVLAAWPLLVLVQLGVIRVSAVPGWFIPGYPPAAVGRLVVVNSGGHLVDSARLWVPAVLFLLVGSALAVPWTRWWSRRPVDTSRTRAAPPVTAAAVVAAVLAAALLLTG